MKKSRHSSRSRRFSPRAFESLEARVLLDAHGFGSVLAAQHDSVDAAVQVLHSRIHYEGNAHSQSGELRLSASGKPYYRDPAHAQAAGTSEEDAAEAKAEGPKVPLDQIPAYHSYPGAANVFYLDFDGQLVDDTDWNDDNGGKRIHAVPYDTDGDPTTFDTKELDAIHEIWQRVSEDFVPFDIDVTTEEPAEADLNSGRGAIRAIISTNVDDRSLGGTGDVWFPDAGGVAFISSWLWSGDIPVWVFYNEIPQTAKAIAEAATHEFGHAVGLGHDGGRDSAYYSGHGSGEMSWAPIMGAGYNKNVTQWSKGEYSGATNSENDLSTITHRVNHIKYRPDDHGQANEDATALVNEGGHVSGQGVIETSTDYDVFSFQHSGGPVNLLISPAEVGPNVDIVVELYDENSSVIPIAEYAPQESLSVTISTVLEPGTYYLLVDGGAYVPATGEGFSDYGSIGTYTIDGFLGAPKLTANAGGPYIIDEGDSLVVDGTRSFGPIEQLLFHWDIDGNGTFGDAVGATVELSWEALSNLDVPIDDQGEYSVKLRVTDDNGNQSEDAAPLLVNNLPPQVALNAPSRVFLGDTVQFSADATDIPEDPLTYEWDFGDGSESLVDASTVEHTYSKLGIYNVTLVVTDDEGKDTTVTAAVEVVIDLPVVVSSSVADGDVVGEFDTFAIAFNQDVSSRLNPSTLTIIDTVSNSATNPANPSVSWDAVTNTAEFSTRGLAAGKYLLIVGGLVNTDSIRLDGNGDGREGGNWSANVIMTFVGDVDLDLDVDLTDFLIMAENFGQHDARWAQGDLNRDGVVSFSDFLILAEHFGASAADLDRA